MITKNGEVINIATRVNRLCCSNEAGCYYEILPEDIILDNIIECKDQLWRNSDRYKNCKYRWFVPVGDNDVKIYLQTKEVGYADYRVGCYYVAYDSFEDFSVEVNEEIPVVWGKL